jgi:hypothetical protein
MQPTLVVAQALGEYGALAGLASAFQTVRYQVEMTVREHTIPIVAIAIVAGYFLLRRR